MRSERQTQNRVIKLFETLGYQYLGDKTNTTNRNLEASLLKTNLAKRGYNQQQIDAAITRFEKTIDNTSESLYQDNLATYKLLDYGVDIKLTKDANYDTIQLIDWQHTNNNHFAIAEEVTLNYAGKERRIDLVLYINGIAVAAIELKSCVNDIGEGIRQLISNQQKQFNQTFFNTIQLLIAASDTQGIKYGTTDTAEKLFMPWKTEVATTTAGCFLDQPLQQLCDKHVLLDIIKNCIVFDAGIKKLPRQHQYNAMHASKTKINNKVGGIIWHTQGSGKSILMIMLARWILANNPNARVLIVTDRNELDTQIESVMRNAGLVTSSEPSPRITSRNDLITKLEATTPHLLCALIHKFETTDLSGVTPNIKGDFYVLVDECHRTQGGKMNMQMKRWLPKAIFIGFSGTPLLKTEKETSVEVFGDYIHTYKYKQAVEDGIVLDLKYEARNVPQSITDKTQIDQYFEQKTQGLSLTQQHILKKRWATMEKLVSSKAPKERIIASILVDFDLKPRLNDGTGTAILVAGSVYDACEYYRLLQNTPLANKCGLITSYNPVATKQSTLADGSDEQYKYQTYTKYILKNNQKTEQYEEQQKKLFIKEPAKCKLLIVVYKLLTGFDAPSCTYLYLDKKIEDHNLFQAICRTNRLDGDDKEFGYIVDFKQMFEGISEAIAIYSSDELDTSDTTEPEDNNIKIKNYLEAGKQQLETTREQLKYLCEPVAEPKQSEQYISYFCGVNEVDLQDKQLLRTKFYQAVASFMRAYANVVTNIQDTSFTIAEIDYIKQEIKHYADMLTAVKLAAAEELDTKPYEQDMRHLLNTYVDASTAEILGDLNDNSLYNLVIATGIHEAIAKKFGDKLKQKNIAEGIINNIQQILVSKQHQDPAYYAKISEKLVELTQQQRESAEGYQQFLANAEQLINNINKPTQDYKLPNILTGKPEAIVIYNNLASIDYENYSCPNNTQEKAELAVAIDMIILDNKQHGWLGDQAKERMLKKNLYEKLQDATATEALFSIIKQQSRYTE